MMDQEPLVSVMVITYNHAKYIERAIRSVLEQKCDFQFKIHVIEDCSTDGTQSILKELKEKYPDQILLYLNEKNIGHKVTQKNFIQGFKTLKSKYVAILEGDDYWAYENKLQFQVDFLEHNEDFAGCAHNVIKFYNDQDFPSERFLYNRGIKSVHGVEDFISMQSFFHTSTFVFRNVFKNNVPNEFADPYSCDIFVTIAHAQFGKIRYFDKDWGKYRVHSGGRFSGMTPLQGWFFNINGLRRYNAWLKYRYCFYFAKAIIKYSRHVLHQKRIGNCELTIIQRLFLYYLLFIYSVIKGCAFIVQKNVRKIQEIEPNISQYTHLVID